jgi:hypothetical protein
MERWSEFKLPVIRHEKAPSGQTLEGWKAKPVFRQGSNEGGSLSFE